MSWTQFQFFDDTPIPDPYLGTKHILYSDPTLSCIVSYSDGYVIAVDSTTVKLVSHDFELVHSFTAYEHGYDITHLHALENSTYFFTVAEKLGSPSVLKVWNYTLCKDQHSFHTQCEIKNGANSFPISCVTYSNDLSLVAVGYVSGQVVLIRGDMLRDRGSRQRIIYDSPDPITCLYLSEDQLHLFAATTSRIMTFVTNGKNSGQPDSILSMAGADLHCTMLLKNELVVGTPETVDFYKGNGEKRTVVLEVPKKRLFVWDEYVLVVSQVESASQSVLTSSQITTKIGIYDTKHTLAVFSMAVSGAIKTIFMGEKGIMLLGSDGVLHQLIEKSLDQKVDMAIERELFAVALQLSDDEQTVRDIHKRYGDSLLLKGDKDAAMDQYVQCITQSRTSEVIEKFRDSDSNLSRYLEEMLHMDLAQKEHVTLLLITYVKMGQLDKIENYIEQSEYEEGDEPPFDLECVLSLCSETGYLKEAVKLNRKFGDPLRTVGIILEELNDSEAAIKYIKTLPIEDTLRILISYSGILLEELPNDTNLLVIDVFSGNYKQMKENDVEISKHDKQFSNYQAFLTFMTSGKLQSSNSSISDTEVNSEPTYHPPRPRLIFTSYMKRPFEFVVFLEAMLTTYDKYEGSDKDKQDILTTLYDIYLSLANDEPEKKKEWENKATGIANKLKDNENDLSLLISHMNKFHKFLNFDDSASISSSETTKSQHVNMIDTFRSFIIAEDVSKVLLFLERYGSREHKFYTMALSFFISSKSIFEQIGEGDFKSKILKPIEDHKLLSPLSLVQILSTTQVANIGLIKDYLIRYLQMEQQEIEKNNLLIKSYRDETAGKQQELESKLRQKIDDRSRCGVCQMLIDNPAVHFKCKHSYHQHCLTLTNGIYRCPQCVVEQDTLKSLRTKQMSKDLFNKEIDQAKSDKFRVVAEFIGRGVMDRT